MTGSVGWAIRYMLPSVEHLLSVRLGYTSQQLCKAAGFHLALQLRQPKLWRRVTMRVLEFEVLSDAELQLGTGPGVVALLLVPGWPG